MHGALHGQASTDLLLLRILDVSDSNSAPSASLLVCESSNL